MHTSLMFTAKSMLYTLEDQGEKIDKILMETKQGKRRKMLTKQWRSKKLQQKKQDIPCMSGVDSSQIIWRWQKQSLMSNIFKQSHFVWSLIMFFSQQRTHPNAYLLFDKNIGEYNRLSNQTWTVMSVSEVLSLGSHLNLIQCFPSSEL